MEGGLFQTYDHQRNKMVELRPSTCWVSAWKGHQLQVGPGHPLHPSCAVPVGLCARVSAESQVSKGEWPSHEALLKAFQKWAPNYDLHTQALCFRGFELKRESCQSLHGLGRSSFVHFLSPFHDWLIHQLSDLYTALFPHSDTLVKQKGGPPYSISFIVLISWSL